MATWSAPLAFASSAFLVGRGRADHGCAQMFGPLAQDQPHAAGRRVDQHRIARLHPVGAAQQILGGHALEHHAGGGFLGDGGGQLHQPFRRHDAALGIGAVGRAGIADPVADRALGDAVADRLHRARTLDADDERQLRHRPGMRHAAPVVGVDIVHADGAVPDQHLARTRLAGRPVLPAENVGRAFLVDDGGLVAHGCSRSVLGLGSAPGRCCRGAIPERITTSP